MPQANLKIEKNICSLNCLQAAALSFPETGVQIEETSDAWNITLISAEHDIKESAFLRALNEYALRESLEKKFFAERAAIYKLAFEQD